MACAIMRCTSPTAEIINLHETSDLPPLDIPQAGPDGRIDWNSYFDIYLLHHPKADSNNDGLLVAQEYTSHKARLHKYMAIEALGDGVEFKEDLSYAKVDNHDLKLDLYLPRERSKVVPVVMWLHGGGWKGSSKDHCLLSWLSKEGYAVASVEFRSTSVAPFPNNIFDCKAAIRWLKANAEKYKIDPNKIIVSGHSSGGHLAALLATSGDVDELEGEVKNHANQSTQVQGLISIAGAIDLKAWANTKENLALVMGLKSDEDIDQIATLCSPAEYLSSHDPPALLLHGGQDHIVRLHHSKDFQELYLKNELEATLHIYEDKSHGHRFVTAEEKAPVISFLENLK